MLTLEQLEATIKKACLEEAEYSKYTQQQVQGMLHKIEEQAYIGKDFNRTRQLLGLHQAESICDLLKQYHELHQAEKQAAVAMTAYQIALSPDPKDASPMIKHITQTQMDWNTTSNHQLKDVSGQDTFTLERDDS